MALSPIYFNSSYTCYIRPNLTDYPNGLFLDFDTCPDDFESNSTPKLINVCCAEIVINTLGDSYYGRMDRFFRYYGVSVLVGPAIFFNLLALIVLTKFSNLQNGTSTRFYMQALCVFDALCIIAKFINEHVYIRNEVRDQPFPLNAIYCKSIFFAESIFTTTSVYVLIVMSFDKLICVLLPLKVGSLLTVNKARLICAIIVFLAIIFSAYHLFINDVKIIELTKTLPSSAINGNNNTHFNNRSNSITNFKYDCMQDTTWEKPLKQLRNFVTIFTPIILLFLCNMSISIALAKATKNAKSLMGDGCSEYSASIAEPSRVHNHSIIYLNEKQKNANNCTQLTNLIIDDEEENTNNKKKMVICCPKRKRSKDSDIVYSRNQRLSRPSNEINLRRTKAKKNSHYISFMLFAVCFGFVILNLPYAIHSIFESKLAAVYGQTGKITKTTYVELVKYDLFNLICHFLIDLSHVVNFFLYYLSGSKFRSQLYGILGCKMHKKRNRNNNFFPPNKKGLIARIRNFFYRNNSNSFINENYIPHRKSTMVTAKMNEGH